MTWNLPNVITTVRLLLTPVLVYLLYRNTMSGRLAAFLVFAVAALSDLWDGYLARNRDQVTDYGKLADPIADKLLLAAALVPVHLLTADSEALGGIPLYGGVALWVVVILLGREALITGLRLLAARRGEVVASSRAGKYKAFTQNLFLGATVLWTAFRTGAARQGWSGAGWEMWQIFHGWFITATLTGALVLTVYSMALYLVAFSRILR